ncbi:MAG: hypothetical protein HYV26_21055 [Candidatus Hydrogenedentes bacterium]|nr:hypothetical protein [Candidatus Hydrogenedentota bacterium]
MRQEVMNHPDTARMDKLSLVCACGQEMVVPESALGRSGLCPGCGQQIEITRDNTQPYRPRRRETGGRMLAVRRREVRQEDNHREEAWRNFATAVDLYNGRRYAEALTLLNTLLQHFPGNEHVETARDQCLEALQRTTHSAHHYEGRPIDDGVLSPELVKSVVLDKMLNGATDEVQLQAAELAARLLGVLGGRQPETGETALALPEAGTLLGEPLSALLQEEVPANGGAKNTRKGRRGRGRKPQAPVPSPVTAAAEDTAGANPIATPPDNGSSTHAKLLLPDDWRLARARSTRFPGKIVFE